jgi:hypothetical protein
LVDQALPIPLSLAKPISYQSKREPKHARLNEAIGASKTSITWRRSRKTTASIVSHSKRLRWGLRHFYAVGTFCARFRHATTKPRTHRARAVFTHIPQASLISLAGTMPYAIYRGQFDRRRKCADALKHRSNVCLARHKSAPASRKSAARWSSRGPDWLSSSETRVRSHPSRLARAHHQDSQDSVVVLVVCEA